MVDSRHFLTDEIVRVEEIIVPDLEGDLWWKPTFCLVQTEEMLKLPCNHDLLLRDVLEREDQPPVEVTFSIHGSIVNISFLGFFFSLEPTEGENTNT